MVGEKIGQFRVIERLGAGGMSSVYRALDDAGREVALKILEDKVESGAARLRAEAAALSRLSHPGIATVYELFEADGRLVLAMELLRGETLQDLIDRIGPLPARDAAELCIQTLAALNHAHTAGVVHRDVKLANLMLTEDGSIRIMDFGIARHDGSVGLTHAGAMVGTPAYMAPEQVLGNPIDARTDLYAMGVVLFRLVTATLPFRGETPFEMAQSHLNDAPEKAANVREDVPAWVDVIVSRALEKTPEDRFQSAEEFQEALAVAIATTPQMNNAPGVESTEVLTRPIAISPPKNPRPPHVLWLTAAATVIATTVWSLSPFGASPADFAQTPTTAFHASTDAPRRALQTPAAQVRVQPVSLAPKPAPAKAAARPARTVASFANLKFLVVNGARTTASDVMVHFTEKDVTLQSSSGHPATEAMSYRHIAKATYTQGRDPKWDPEFSAPTGKIEVSGFIGRSRHWLVLQARDRYVILRLDGDDRQEVMRAFEERAGISIDRAADAKKQQ